MIDQRDHVSTFGEILLYIVGAILFVMVSLVISRLVRPNRPNPEKLSSYETGEEALGSPWTQFNIRFYIVALIFLLFEVELVFLFPWSTVFGQKVLNDATNGLWGWFSLIEMFIFIGVLAIGLAYAWLNGYLDWIKPDPKPTEYKSNIPPDLYEKINEKYKSK